MEKMKIKSELTPAEKWESLTLANNFLFCAVMRRNPELCRELLEILLHIEIEKIEIPETELSIQDAFDSKGIRLDVYTKSDGRVFDIEMQTTKKLDLPKRARYYQSIIDSANLTVGADYDELKDSYVIFICLDDIFGKGLPVYTFENLCMENKETKLNDRAFKLFFNASACDRLNSESERNFFRFLKNNETSDDFTQKLNETVGKAKQSAELRGHYMTWEQNIKEERKLAYMDGAHDTARENASEFLKMGISAEQVSKGTKLPLEEVLALKEELSHEAQLTR